MLERNKQHETRIKNLVSYGSQIKIKILMRICTIEQTSNLTPPLIYMDRCTIKLSRLVLPLLENVDRLTF